MSSITLSPKHGVNPSLIKCFWCGRDMGIALCGKLKGDEQSPHEIVVSYEPCEDCKEAFSHGIHVIGVSETPAVENMLPITEQLYPTGNHLVIPEKMLMDCLLVPNGEETCIDKVREKGAICVPDTVAMQFIDMVKSWECDKGGFPEEEDNNEENQSGLSEDNGTESGEED